jgi:hypothetical protein
MICSSPAYSRKKYSAMVTRFRGIPKKLDMAGLVLEVVY